MTRAILRRLAAHIYVGVGIVVFDFIFITRRSKMKILFLDIETAPNTVHVWGLRKQDVSIKQIINSGYTLCWAAKWQDKKTIIFSSLLETTKRRMLHKVHKLIDEADAIVHYNGTRFDIPKLNWEFLKCGLEPPSPHFNIDLYLACRKKFNATSLKLDFVVNELGLGGKVNHKGHQLWIDCMGLAGVTQQAYQKAWGLMKRYNKQDVTLIERLYIKLLPWISQHPNYNVYNDDGVTVCINCGSLKIQRRGLYRTRAGTYQRFCCNICGKWMRGRFTQLSSETKETMLVPAL